MIAAIDYDVTYLDETSNSSNFYNEQIQGVRSVVAGRDRTSDDYPEKA